MYNYKEHTIYFAVMIIIKDCAASEDVVGHKGY